MEIFTFETAQSAAAAVARRMAAAVNAHPQMVLGLATGRTPIPVYAALARMCAARDVSFGRVATFNLDEFSGLGAADPGSFRRFMDEHLFSHIDINPTRIHFLNGLAADADAECDRYEVDLDSAGGQDLQLLGIGANGHIGFNEPGDALASRTHRVTLHDVTRRENAALFGGQQDRVPREALSMGMGTILKARALILMAVGQRKARCVERALHGPLTTRLPASFLQLHPKVELYLDRAAAALLPDRA